MDLALARKMTMDLMTQYGVDEAHFEWMEKKSRLGEAGWDAKKGTTVLRLNRTITRHSEIEDVRQTMLHEIAHLLVGPQHHHDSVWKRKAFEIGYRGARTSNVPDEVHALQNWVGTCPAGHVSSRARAPREGRKVSCGRCSRRYSEANLITWQRGFEYRVAQRKAGEQS